MTPAYKVHTFGESSLPSIPGAAHLRRYAELNATLLLRTYLVCTVTPKNKTLQQVKYAINCLKPGGNSI